MSQSSSNRRRTRRQSPKKTVKFLCRKGPWGMGANVARTLLDVSLDGARMILSEALEHGQEVALSLEGPWHVRPVNIPAKVCWCAALADGSYCVGVHFEKTLPYSEMQDLASINSG